MIRKMLMTVFVLSGVCFGAMANVANISDLKESIVILLNQQREINARLDEIQKEQKNIMDTFKKASEDREELVKKVDERVSEAVKEVGKKSEDLDGVQEFAKEMGEALKENMGNIYKLSDDVTKLQDNLLAVQDEINVILKDKKNPSQGNGNQKNIDLRAEMKKDYVVEMIEGIVTEKLKKGPKANNVNQTIIRFDASDLSEEEARELFGTKAPQNNSPVVDNIDIEKKINAIAQKVVTQILNENLKRMEEKASVSEKQKASADKNDKSVYSASWYVSILGRLKRLESAMDVFDEKQQEYMNWTEHRINVLEKSLKKCCSIKKTGSNEFEVLEYELK